MGTRTHAVRRAAMVVTLTLVAALLPLLPTSGSEVPGTAPKTPTLLPAAEAATSDGFGEFERFVGRFGYSADGLGQSGGGGSLDYDVPADAAVHKAFLYGSYYSTTSPSLHQRTLTIAGRQVELQTIPSGAGSFLSAARADVTELVAAQVAATPGAGSLTVANDPPGLDGVALLVIYRDDSRPVSTIAVVDGGAAQSGQRTTLDFVTPLDTDQPGFQAQMSLGIGFGYQGTDGHTCGRVNQSSIIQVNGTLLSSCAGGYDDGYGANGGLITVGGVGDELDNPADPTQRPGSQQPRVVDDELYDLRPFVADGDGSLVIETSNPSRDDIIFLTVVAISARVEAVTSIPTGQTFGAGTGTHAVNPTGFLSDPVNSATGAFVTQATDLLDATPLGGMQFTRTYTSLDGRISALGRGWSFDHGVRLEPDGDGTVVLVAEDGQRVRYEPMGNGTFRAPAGGNSELRQADDGYVLHRRDGTRYTFTPTGLLTGVDTPSGGRRTYEHDGDRVTTVEDQAGRRLTFSYDPSGRLTRATSSDGRQVTYRHTGDLLTEVVDTRGGVTRYEYDQDERLSRITDQNGHVDVENVYGPSGRIVQQRDATGATSSFGWDPSTQTATLTDALGHTWSDTYDGNVLQRRTDPAGHTTKFEWDNDLRLTALVDAAGGRFELAYDADGLPVRLTGPDGVSVAIGRNGAGQVVEMTRALGSRLTSTREADGRITSTTGPDGATSTFGYPTNGGLPTELTDPTGHQTTLQRDATGAPVTVTRPSGATTTLEYDARGLINTTSGPASPSATMQLGHDAAGNLTDITDPLGHKSTREYDAVGNLVATTDARGHTTRYAYDAADRLVEVIAPDGATTAYDHDAVGRLSSRTGPRGDETTYSYDPAGRLTAMTSATGQRWTYAYDPVGHVERVTTPAGTATPESADGTIAYRRDALYRVVEVDYSDDTPDVTYEYDTLGRRIAMHDGTGNTTYSYDGASRLASVDHNGQTTSYSYDAAGRVVSRTYPDGREVIYTWDVDGRLAAVADGRGETRYDHDPAGRVIAVKHPDGTRDVYVHDDIGRLVEQRVERDDKILDGQRLELDAHGNPTRVADLSPGGSETRIRTLAYDSLDRLTSECHAAACRTGKGRATVEYSYDEVGNRVRETRPGQDTTYTYDPANQLEQITRGTKPTAIEHDVNGNVIRDDAGTYEYDLENRLVAFTDARTGDTTRYGYDGDGLPHRIGGDTQGGYEWDVNAPVPLLVRQTHDGSSQAFTHGHALLGMDGDDGPLTVHTDQLGSVVATTDGGRSLVHRMDYTAFGQLASTSKLPSSRPIPGIGFAGMAVDPHTGLLGLSARRYDPTIGRFLQRDPMSLPLTEPAVSAYLYAGNRPTVITDPSGLFCVLGHNPDGSCRGSGVTSAVGKGVASGAGWVWDHRYQVGSVVVAGTCVAGAVATAGALGAACLAGGGLLFGGQVVEAGIRANRGPGFAYRQFFGEAGLAAFQTWAVMIPGLGLEWAAIRAAGYGPIARFATATVAELPGLLCALLCPPTSTIRPPSSTYSGLTGRSGGK